MPNNKNRNKNKNFNRNRHYQNGGGHGGGGGGGGQGRHSVHNNGIQKWPRGGKHSGNRHIYINPTAIESLDDNYETEAPHSSNYNQNNRYRSDDRGKKNRVINRLKEMGNVKPKLSIGDTDQEVKKTLLESKPHCQLSSVPSDVFQLIVTYIQKYFTCFDSNRESLLEAYHSKCTFSFAINLNNPEAHRSFKFDDFIYKENRNLKRISGLDETHHEKRYRLLHQGKIDTVSFINKLPPTEHEPTSFKLDCCFFTPAMISFSLNGVYREGKPTDKVRPFRSFQRIFVCIPDPNTQMSIVNEEFIMANMSREQYQKYYASLESAPKPDQVEPVATPVPQQVQPTSQPSTILQPIAQNLTQEQLLMIEQFSRESRLNMEWSKHCLDHSQWNFEEAAKQFLQHKDKIPKDAFLI